MPAAEAAVGAWGEDGDGDGWGLRDDDVAAGIRPDAARGLTHAHPPERDRESRWSLGTLIGSDTGTFSGTRISDSPSTATNARRIP